MGSYISTENKCLTVIDNPDDKRIDSTKKSIFSIPIVVYEILKYVSYFDLDDILPLFGLPTDMAQAIKQQIYSSRVKVATRFYYIEDQSDKYDGLARMLFADAGISMDDDDDSNSEVDEPAKNNIGTYIEYSVEGKLHREDGPAIESLNGDKEWWINGEFHRDDDLPAVEFADGDKEWYLHGKKHRLNGPAVIHHNGEEYWVDGELHRTDGPAIVITHGDKEWWVNGKRHRTDGPAIEFVEGAKAWYLDGIRQRPPRTPLEINTPYTMCLIL